MSKLDENYRWYYRIGVFHGSCIGFIIGALFVMLAVVTMP